MVVDVEEVAAAQVDVAGFVTGRHRLWLSTTALTVERSGSSVTVIVPPKRLETSADLADHQVPCRKTDR